MISEAELAWVAGFFDGEGSIRIAKRQLKRRRTPEYLIVTELTNTNKEIVAFLKDLMGGYVREFGGNDNEKRAYKWVAAANDARHIIESLLPYLRLKRKQGELALELANGLGHFFRYRQPVPKIEVARREQIYQMMKVLNRRGKAGLEQGFQTEIVMERRQKPRMI